MTGLSLGGNSQKSLIMERANELNEQFEESLKHNFHNKYDMCEDNKLGAGQHATVFLCYLKEEEKKASNLTTVKSFDVDSNKSELDDADQIFDRAKSIEDTRKKYAVKVTRDDD